MTKCTQPIIILGMHRSGTTMLTKMLRELGLFVGWDFSDEYEALFFLNRNEKLLHVSGGGWYNPSTIDNILNHSDLRKKIVNLLYQDLKSFYSIYFLGPTLFLKFKSVVNLTIPWGWKDPRNTFLLPLWLDIFPDAKIIHIYRNGLDVASSLAVREEKRINKATRNRRTVTEIFASQLSQIAEKRHLLFLIQKVQDCYSRLSPLGKFGRLKIHPCISLEKGFDLWRIYTEKAFNHVEAIPNETYTLKYEDFLAEPERFLIELHDFCSLTSDATKIRDVASKVNIKRRYAFQQDEKLMKLYEAVKDTQLMQKLGYQLEMQP